MEYILILFLASATLFLYSDLSSTKERVAKLEKLVKNDKDDQ